MEPSADESLLGLVKVSLASGRPLGNEAVDAVLLISVLPSRLGEHRVAECLGDLVLPDQPREPQVDGDRPQMNFIRQSETIERQFPSEHDAISVPIDEVERAVNDGAVGDGGKFQRQFLLDGVDGIHTAMNPASSKKFLKNLSRFSPNQPRENRRKLREP